MAGRSLPPAVAARKGGPSCNCVLALRSIEHVDIVNLDSAKALRQRLDARELDVLFVNAGICKANELNTLQVAESDYLDMLLTNALSPMRLIELFYDRLNATSVAAVMSSELGSITDANGFWDLYSSSKAALNML